MKVNYYKNKQGITLIALVITIIVLLILAGITIAMIVGDNGILTRANEAKIETDVANEAEQIQIALATSKINENGEIDKEVLRSELTKLGFTWEETEDKWYVKGRERTYVIDMKTNDVIDVNNASSAATDETVTIRGRAIFDVGDVVNIKIKKLAGNDTSSQGRSTDDENITAIVRSSTKPDMTFTSDNIISSAKSDINIYAWFNNGTLYYYTEDERPMLNKNSLFMFNRLTAVKSIDVSSFDTSNTTDMNTMFQACYELENLSLSNFDTSKVTDMKFMFAACWTLTSLDLSMFDTSNVEFMNNMFMYCEGLENLNVSSFNTTNVSNMSNMFYDCRGLTTINVGGFNTSKVTLMDNMFGYCLSMRNIDISGFNTSNVTNMANMFDCCISLTSLDVSHFITTNVTDMNSMFNYCINLTSLNVSGLNTSNVTNMSYMFCDCCQLTTINVSGFNTEKVTDLSGTFHNCSSLTSLDVSGFNTSNVTKMDHTFNVSDDDPLGKKYSNLSSLNLSGWDTTKVVDMEWFIDSLQYVTTEFTVRGNVTSYEGMLSDVATKGGHVIVNYTDATESIVDRMLETATAGSNVVKGSLVQ